ncbi:two-component system response regulator [Paraglaciecola arctica]|uniref:two-component system response regulator n=1 Tax=Paraglaciecola arctica TaxID=1128911 RepID=UPI001C075887|nr:EAL domain-containing protein [Paraglaciecola arctica]MBU3005077.1 EAL domain-containing protein [Paraglaciecola arctica]
MNGQLRQVFYPEYGPSQKQENILVVDDDPGILRIISLVLEKEGYKVRTATSGEQAYQLACSFYPELVILDINMPGGWNGFLTCQKFKSDAQLSAIPIIFLTATTAELLQGFEVGGADCLLKPFNNQELIVRTQFHLNMNRLVKEAQQTNLELESKVQQRNRDLADSNEKLKQAILESRLLNNRLKLEEGTDFLTKLPNGVSFERNLQCYLDQRTFDATDGVLLFLDLVRFEVVNQCFGWDAGDYVLCNVSNLLQSQLGDSALLGRLGGDQFAVFLKHTSVTNAAVVARGLVDCLSSFPFSFKSQKIQAEICVGFCVVDEHESSARKITSKAIHASIQAKKQGLGSIVNYQNVGVRQLAKETTSDLASRIESALKSNALSLFYQQVNPLQAQQDQLPSFEMLVKLNSEDANQLKLPKEYIEVSGRNQINKKIDLWVLQATLNWLQDNQHLHSQFSHVSINLSSETITNPMFLITLENILLETSIKPGLLCFIISESDVLLTIERSGVFLSHLKKLGCKTCLDDFGGQTSLIQYLHILELDYLKIDAAVIGGYSENPSNTLLWETLTKVAELSGKALIAKHIEHETVADNLIEIGIKHAQGSLFHKPEPISNLS